MKEEPTPARELALPRHQGHVVLDTTHSYTGVTYCTVTDQVSTECEDHSSVVPATFANGTSKTLAAPVAGC
jgi:hypothetical protein